MANAWAGYCQNNICRAGGCSQAGIYDIGTAAAWGTTAGMKASAPQVQALCKALNSTEQSDQPVKDLQAAGIKIGETKYMFLQIDRTKPVTILGKSKDGGCVIQKSNKAVVVGTYATGATPGESNKTVTQFTDWLINSGY